MSEFKINEIQVKSVLSKSNLPVSDYSVNPYIGCQHACKYCYASFMKRFTGHIEPWGKFVDIKDWKEIKNPHKYDGKELFIGSVTDPYQPLEMKYKRTRLLLEQLLGSQCKISIATKSDLVIRDLDLLKQFKDVRVSFSINTLDNDFKNDMDCSVSVERKIEAMKKLHEAGIRTTCFISPIFPGITDCKAIIRKCKDICNLIWLENLNLRGDYKPVILNYIKKKHPELVSLYDEIYRKNKRDYWFKLNDELREFCRSENLEYIRDDDSMQRPFDAKPIVVNYFFHEEVKRNSTKENSIE